MSGTVPSESLSVTQLLLFLSSPWTNGWSTICPLFGPGASCHDSTNQSTTTLSLSLVSQSSFCPLLWINTLSAPGPNSRSTTGSRRRDKHTNSSHNLMARNIFAHLTRRLRLRGCVGDIECPRTNSLSVTDPDARWTDQRQRVAIGNTKGRLGYFSSALCLRNTRSIYYAQFRDLCLALSRPNLCP